MTKSFRRFSGLAIAEGKCLRCGHDEHTLCFAAGFFGDYCMCDEFIPRGAPIERVRRTTAALRHA